MSTTITFTRVGEGVASSTKKHVLAHDCVQDGAVFQTHSKPDIAKGTGRQLDLPGEYEIEQILIKGLYTDERRNVVYRIGMKDLTYVHFGHQQGDITANVFEALGEHVTVAIIKAGGAMDAKAIDKLRDKMSPPLTIIYGDLALQVSVVAETNAVVHEGEFTLKTSEINPEAEQTIWLNA